VSTALNWPTTRRTVLVLGRSAAGSNVPNADDLDDTLTVLAIGWPLTAPQRAALEAAEHAARAARVVFDARLLASLGGVLPLVQAADRLMVDAKPRESKRIKRALDRA
jgi:hypothetical protein